MNTYAEYEHALLIARADELATQSRKLRERALLATGDERKQLWDEAESIWYQMDEIYRKLEAQPA